MKFTFSWLRDHLDTTHSLAEVADKLTLIGLEVDIQCRRDKGEIRFGEGEDWMEILGCGMVHPNVLRACGIDPDEYQGFAWGMGIDRIAMLKYGIADLRQLFDSDVRWLNHYGFKPLEVPTLAGGLSS